MPLSVLPGRLTASLALFLCVVFVTACGGGGGGGGGTPTPANQAPSFSGATSFTFAENEAIDFLLSVTDPDSTTVTITGVNGGDSALFVLDTGSGRITANTASGLFDFENPLDANADNVYEQELELSDGVNTVRDTISVTVTNVDEGPEFTQLPEVALNEGFTGELVTFQASDPEGGTVSSFAIVEVSKLGEPVNSQRLLDAFSIDPQTGALSVEVAFDAEVDGTQDRISVAVEASDGAVTGFGSVSIRLVDLPSELSQGLRVSGVSSIEPLGDTASAVGDIDGDGADELWVGQTTDEAGVETAFLLFSTALRDAIAADRRDELISDFASTERVRISGDDRSATDRRSVLNAVSAGDVDADGVGDVLVLPSDTRGFAFPDEESGPTATLLWGDQLATDSLDLNALPAGAGVRLTGLSRFGNLGITGSAADVDGDGRSDVVLGLPGLNRSLLIFGSALEAAGDELDLSSAAASDVVVIRSELTAQAIIQQTGQRVGTIADLGVDGLPEVVIAGVGLEPDFANAVFVVDSAALLAARAGSGVYNLSDDGNDADVLELRVLDAEIVGLATDGDVDGDGRVDLAMSHIGSNDNRRIATLVYGATLASAFGTAADPSLELTDPAEGIALFADNQIASVTIGSNVDVALTPSFGGGAGSELVVTIDAIDSLGRTSNGMVFVFDDAALVASPDAQIRFDNDAFPAPLGRRLLGYATGALTGRSLFVTDVDGDGRVDLGTASTGAGSDSVGPDSGGFVVIPGSLVLDAFGQSEADVDLGQTLVTEG